MDIYHLMNNLTNNNLTANEQRQANKGRADPRPTYSQARWYKYYLILSVVFLI